MAEFILNKKEMITPKELWQGLPIEFARILEYVRDIKFKEEPDYEYIFASLEAAMERNSIENDGIYDWVRPKLDDETESIPEELNTPSK